MFLIRTTLFLGLGVLVLPTDEASQARITSGAKSALTWSLTFCDRNGPTCAQGRDYWAVFLKKAEFGTKMAFELISERNRQLADGPATGAGALVKMPVAPTLNTQDTVRPRGTLRAQDLEPAWRGKIAFHKSG